jgi:hypothetical protein
MKSTKTEVKKKPLNKLVKDEVSDFSIGEIVTPVDINCSHLNLVEEGSNQYCLVCGKKVR